MLREAVNLLQPLLTGGTLLEGNFRWMCASLVPLGGFRSMGRTERPVFACRPAMQQHMQQLWTRRLSTPWAAARTTCLRGTCHGAREVGPSTPVRDCARAAPEGGDGPAAPTTGSGRQASTVPPVPRPFKAARRALPAGAAGGRALLRAGSRGTPYGSGGDSSLVKGPASVASAAGAATRAASQAPLRGAGTGSGGPPLAAGLLLAQPASMAPPGAEHPAVVRIAPPPPPRGIQRAPRRPVGALGGGGRPVRAESLSGSGLMGPGG